MHVDFNSLKSVKSFGKEYLNKNCPLDILINNAGLISKNEYEITEDGFEKHFGVNVLAPYYLTRILLPKLRLTPNSRVIFLSSLGHWFSYPFYSVSPAKV